MGKLAYGNNVQEKRRTHEHADIGHNGLFGKTVFYVWIRQPIPENFADKETAGVQKYKMIKQKKTKKCYFVPNNKTEV